MEWLLSQDHVIYMLYDSMFPRKAASQVRIIAVVWSFPIYVLCFGAFLDIFIAAAALCLLLLATYGLVLQGAEGFDNSLLAGNPVVDGDEAGQY